MDAGKNFRSPVRYGFAGVSAVNHRRVVSAWLNKTRTSEIRSMNYTYFLQEGKGKLLDSLRRYADGEEKGQRWLLDKRLWTRECADRTACVLTRDKTLTEREAAQIVGAGGLV